MSRALLLSAYLLFLFVLLEGAARIYLYAVIDTPPLHPPERLNSFYPALEPVLENRSRADDDVFDLLILAGSVPHADWSEIPERLERSLETALGEEVRIHNLAEPARTTRDSRIKQQLLGDLEFDAIVVYHGINDVRANNVPAEYFREDYSHIYWYETVNGLASVESPIALPYAWIAARAAFNHWRNPERYAPVINPRKGWARFGADLKTPASVMDNLETILRGWPDTPIVLSTFAYFLAPDYTLARFQRKRLDYAEHRSPIELWGRPKDVVAGIEAHNRVIEELARRHPRVRLMDARAALPGGAEFFDDICHLTPAGAQRFVDLLTPILLEIAREHRDADST